MSWKERMDEELETLRTARDELRVQIHLGAADAHDLWEKTEKDYEHLEGRLKVLGEASREAADEIGTAARLLMKEIQAGYDRVRQLL